MSGRRGAHKGAEAPAAEVMAESENVSVVRCGSGGLHVHIGPMAVALSPTEFAEVAAVILCAVERLHRQPVGGAVPGPSRPH